MWLAGRVSHSMLECLHKTDLVELEACVDSYLYLTSNRPDCTVTIYIELVSLTTNFTRWLNPDWSLISVCSETSSSERDASAQVFGISMPWQAKSESHLWFTYDENVEK